MKLRQKYIALVGVAALITALTACSQASGTGTNSPKAAEPSFAAGTTMAKLAKAGAVRVGVKFDQPPFGSKDLQGNHVGFDIDIAKLITADLGIPANKIDWVETTVANREPFLEQNKVDFVVASYAISDKRKEVVSFAGPYLVGHQDLLVKKGNPEHIEGAQDMAGKKICAVGGSTVAANVQQNYPKANLITFDVQSKCVEALRNGQVDAMTAEDNILAGFEAKEPTVFERVGNTFSNEPYGIGIPKGDTAFCSFIDKTLVHAEKDGAYQKAWVSTFGKVFNQKKAPALPEQAACA